MSLPSKRTFALWVVCGTKSALPISTVPITCITAWLDSATGTAACYISMWLVDVGGNTLAITAIVALVHFTFLADEAWRAVTLSRPVAGLHTCPSMVTEFITWPILALVSQEVCRAAAGGLISTINCAVSSILTVVLTCALVTVGSCEACQTTASRSSCRRCSTRSSILAVLFTLV